MVEIGEMEFYETWMNDLYSHVIRVNGPGLGNRKKQMIVTLIPKDGLSILLDKLLSFVDDTTEQYLVHQINDQFSTEIEITRYSESVSMSNRIYRVLIKSCQLVIRADITQDQLETLLSSIQFVVHRDI